MDDEGGVSAYFFRTLIKLIVLSLEASDGWRLEVIDGLTIKTYVNSKANSNC